MSEPLKNALDACAMAIDSQRAAESFVREHRAILSRLAELLQKEHDDLDSIIGVLEYTPKGKAIEQKSLAADRARTLQAMLAETDEP